jgi:signal transduction histidine kinase
MKLTRLLSPIFILCLILLSCKQESFTDDDVKDNYDQHIAIASDFLSQQQYDSSFYYFEKANRAASSKEQKVYALFQMAEIQRIFCDFSGAEATATEAYKNCDSPKYLPYLYNTLGIVYQELYNYDEALLYYNKCYNDTLNEVNKCIVKNNISVVHLAQKDYPKAILILNELAQNDSLKSQKLYYAKVLDNLGYAYFKTGKDNAFNYLNKALQLRDSLDNPRELTATYMHLSEYYQNTDATLSFDYAQKAYAVSKLVQSPDDQLEALKFMIASGEAKAVKGLALRQITLSDSLKKVRQTAKNQFAKIKYDSQQALEERERYKKQKEWTIFISVSVVLGLIILITFIRKRNRKRLQASVQDTENRIAKKIHDELANDVFQTMTFAETQDLENPEKKELLVENLEAIYDKARDISRNNSAIPTDEKFEHALWDLINSFNSESVNVIVKNSPPVDWHKISPSAKNTIYRVLQELLVNMKKHSEAGLVVLVFSSTAKAITIKYTDNGKGLDSLVIDKKGLQNAENRILALKGSLTFENEIHKGFKVSIQIPK